MTITSSQGANDDDEVAASSVQQHRSEPSLHQLQQSLNSLQHLQQYQLLRLQQSPGPDDSSLIPEDNTECLRFYKGFASRDKKQTALTASMIVSCGSSPTEADNRRSFRRRSLRRLHRLRPRLLGRTRRENSPQLATVDEDDSSAGHNMFRPTDGKNQDSAVSMARTSTLDSVSDSSDPFAGQMAAKNSKIDCSGPNKIRYIFNKGRMQAVEVMKWPTGKRIAPSDRYRLAEPMKSMYGRRSMFSRLLKAFEKSKCFVESNDPSDIRGPIPILPRRLVESTKSRLLLWYKPMESSGEF